MRRATLSRPKIRSRRHCPRQTAATFAPDILAVAIRYINKSSCRVTEAPERNLVRQRTARQTGPTASAKQMRQPSRTSQQKPAHRARKVRPGEEVSGSRQRTTGILSWRTDTRSARHPPFHASSSRFRFPWQTGRLVRPGDKRKSRRVLRRLTVLHTGIEPVFVD